MKVLGKIDAEKLVRSTVSTDPGLVAWSQHCKEEMINDDLITNDLLNVLKNGKVRRKAELDDDTSEYIYRIETTKIVIVFKFREFVRGSKKDIGIKLITCWRKKGHRDEL